LQSIAPVRTEGPFRADRHCESNEQEIDHMTSVGALRIGIDVGGTNTDAALMAGRTVLSSAKAPTSPDVITGIVQVIGAAGQGHDLARVDAVVIGTTHFINAVVSAAGLVPVVALRLCTDDPTLGPFTDWPAALATTVNSGVRFARGGHQFDGRLLNALDEDGIRQIATELRAGGRAHVAITAVFSPVSGEHESKAAEILREIDPDFSITLSHQVGRVGLLERENAAILNECLRPMAVSVIDGLVGAMRDSGIADGIYLSQNDGTLMSLERARHFPIFTIASGPTNSMRGAAFLTDAMDAVVVDVGGTTTDVGMLRGGYPRESMVAADLGGVRTNFRIPDVSSLGIGGGSIVHVGKHHLVGPDSVGYELTSRAIVFGGDTMTLTDIAVAAGIADIGDRHRVRHIGRELVAAALGDVRTRISDSVEEAKLSAASLPVIIVGGGASLIPDLPGQTDIVRPLAAGVANAVGAALASAGGEVDSIYSLQRQTRDEILAEARELAIDRAIQAGAAADTISIVDEEDVPLTHLPGGTALRVRVKAIGAVAIERGAHA
jgi:N-methylhydantoinase A/oxoprolinase/acetone carboxylase beta subunit